jgi:hypothetical protein
VPILINVEFNYECGSVKTTSRKRLLLSVSEPCIVFRLRDSYMKLSTCCPFMRLKSREDARVEVSENVQNNNNNASDVIVVARIIILI